MLNILDNSFELLYRISSPNTKFHLLFCLNFPPLNSRFLLLSPPLLSHKPQHLLPTWLVRTENVDHILLGMTKNFIG